MGIGFKLWELVIKVMCGGVYVATFRTRIPVECDIKVFYVAGIKFEVSACEADESITVSTASGTYELNKEDSWFTGECSEPSRDIYIGHEYCFTAEATGVNPRS